MGEWQKIEKINIKEEQKETISQSVKGEQRRRKTRGGHWGGHWRLEWIFHGDMEQWLRIECKEEKKRTRGK